MLSYAHMVILLKIMIDKTDKLERIKKELSEVPTLPGVYLWKDAQGEVIYVGKAKQLRARMRQYRRLKNPLKRRFFIFESARQVFWLLSPIM